MQSFDSSQLPQKSNKWAKLNYSRYVNKQFDALHESAGKEMDPVKFAELVKQMNQLLVDDVALIPLVERSDVSGARRTLRGHQLSGWATTLWALPFWYRV
jgi:peptide/nickel transport system substrate-binding protein